MTEASAPQYHLVPRDGSCELEMQDVNEEERLVNPNWVTLNFLFSDSSNSHVCVFLLLRAISVLQIWKVRLGRLKTMHFHCKLVKTSIFDLFFVDKYWKIF